MPYAYRRPIAQHVFAVEEVGIILPDFIACRTVDSLRHVFRELRFRNKGERQWEAGNTASKKSEEEHNSDYMVKFDEPWYRPSEVVLPFSVSRYLTHRETKFK